MKKRLRELFLESLNDFFIDERENIINDISERNLCSRLAMILESKAIKIGLAGYFADIEYNRKNGRVKTILDDNYVVKKINCDLILHS